MRTYMVSCSTWSKKLGRTLILNYLLVLHSSLIDKCMCSCAAPEHPGCCRIHCKNYHWNFCYWIKGKSIYMKWCCKTTIYFGYKILRIFSFYQLTFIYFTLRVSGLAIASNAMWMYILSYVVFQVCPWTWNFKKSRLGGYLKLWARVTVYTFV